MRILILGGEGMLGHKVFQKLQLRFDTYVTFRDTNGLWLHHPAYNGIDRSHTLGGINAWTLMVWNASFSRSSPLRLLTA
ncbi:MAG: hypothetical protein M0C28_19905 [Candidatus Moduliflexus flocculans]|nr:hypothetical protein [Candidatus Moduliflexus flocculans]